MAKYKVWINVSGYTSYEVEADSENDARNIALEKFNMNTCDELNLEVADVEER